MIIFPAMDLRDGKCVRLYKGQFATSEVVGENPIQKAVAFKNQGAEFLHIVDLDGAKEGQSKNLQTVKDIVKETGLPVQLGGGIRNMQAIESLLSFGVKRVILGTAALNNPALVKEAVRKYSNNIAVGIDAKDGYVAVEGWLKVSNINYIDLSKEMEDIGVKTIIFTDISKDGTLEGPNFEATAILNQEVSCNIIASGGLKSIADIEKLRKMNIHGAIVGKALYSSCISLKDAIEIGRRG